MSFLRTVQAADAHAAATSDRSQAALQILRGAVADAIAVLRRPTVLDRHQMTAAAEATLKTAVIAADRILGDPGGEGPRVGHGTTWHKGGRLIHACTWLCRPTSEGCCWAGERRPHTYVDGVCRWCHRVEGAGQ